MNTPKESYPLTWPDGWKRMMPSSRRKAAFKNNTLGKCCDACADEVQRLGGQRMIISSNIKARLDGRPYSGQAAPTDPGVAVYFELKGKPVALACDKWHLVEDNLWAIVKHIEALRGQERWGVGSVERAFAGYTAIPEKTGGLSWWDVLGVSVNATEEQVTAAYRAKAKIVHPDSGSAPNLEAMVKLNEAYTMATNQRPAK